MDTDPASVALAAVARACEGHTTGQDCRTPSLRLQSALMHLDDVMDGALLRWAAREYHERVNAEIHDLRYRINVLSEPSEQCGRTGNGLFGRSLYCHLRPNHSGDHLDAATGARFHLSPTG